MTCGGLVKYFLGLTTTVSYALLTPGFHFSHCIMSQRRMFYDVALRLFNAAISTTNHTESDRD
jgi:hypothetical protein